MVRSLLQLLDRWPCHILLIDRLKFASLKANLVGSWGLLVYSILLFYLPLSGRSLDMTEILLTGTLKTACEYDQEIPQSQTADNPVAPRGRAAQPSRDTRKTN